MDEPPKLAAEDTLDTFYDVPRRAARRVRLTRTLRR